MAHNFFHRPGTKSRKRLWIAYHAVFGLLLTHFLLVHLMPGYMQAIAPGWKAVFSGHSYGMTGPEVFERDDRLIIWGGQDSPPSISMLRIFSSIPIGCATASDGSTFRR